MIDLIQNQFQKGMTAEQKKNMAREYLQVLCLKIMSDKGMFDFAAFLGGTALRILFDLRRFSEDLDFSLIPGKEFVFGDAAEALLKSYRSYGIEAEGKSREQGAVKSLMIKFPGLFKDLGVAAMPDEKLMIKWDMDTRPPEGAVILHTILNKIHLFGVAHYDLPSMFAGKLHACFFRGYNKGRDWYDFIWYVGRKTVPNFTFLNNAVEQTEKKRLDLSRETFKAFLLERIEGIDFEAAQADVERFLEDEQERRLFDRDLVRSSIERAY
ncbi:MAG TPA: nucleotidyl transferase AbiEii/AbiGii toxin family protein [Candidatus Omnitrophota bacterium]|nr:nucleotidyl transferase AbiEii/AbiGii toxin family protein [Candidatus Omnitrophota bacterium]